MPQKNRNIWAKPLVLFKLITLAILLIYFLKTLTSVGQGPNFEQKFDSCLLKGETKESCWKKLILGELQNRGVEASMEAVVRIYANDPSFGPSCHSFGHLLGGEAYKLFKKGKNFKISPKTSFCSYGFFHGFMEKLVSDTNDFSLARDFCAFADKQITGVSPDTSLQCFHGIGHGWVNVHDRPDLWGDEDKIVENALTLCGKVSANESQLSRCATGVFNGIPDLSGQQKYGLMLNANDPLALCRKQEEKFKDPCYLSFNSVLLSVAKGDFRVAAGFIEDIPEDDYATHALLNLAAVYGLANLESADHSQIAVICRSFQKRLINACFQGYAFAFLEHGEPGKEYVKAVSFCKSDFLAKTEVEACLSYIYTYLAQWYEEEKAFKICESYADREFCKNKVKEYLKRLDLNDE